MDLLSLITATAERYGVSPALALAVAKQESGFSQSARGSAGEIGVFQLMPATAAGLGVNAYDLYQNIEGGVRYLAEQLKRFGGDERAALAAYNGGPGRVASGTAPAAAWSYADKVLSLKSGFVEWVSEVGRSISWPSLPSLSASPAAIPALLVGAAAVALLSLLVLLRK